MALIKLSEKILLPPDVDVKNVSINKCQVILNGSRSVQIVARTYLQDIQDYDCVYENVFMCRNTHTHTWTELQS